ncbi:hypothetical protein Amet_2860 [Alkaliphilus metalliredigens QYMF]|uniref:Uncharacterized protein n=1 Tax=Alkaliphilus metalliredigens (strain QYMF) TaxID=293826 RepID=A6TS42_ALKMQ|nr:DUF3189 family protein [Alkaliphilus metalliredigens]ABR49010.1 hypothetical protein Amet_2860 [Alkaliphilus metalliredigens QYMF]
MKVIYTYRKTPYAAYIAASLHLHMKIEASTIHVQGEWGLRYVGMDENYNEVYICLRGQRLRIFNHLVKSMAEIYEEKIKVIDLSQYEGWRYHFISVEKMISLILQSREEIK